MLCVNSYPADYIAACRARMEAQLRAYDDLIAASGPSGEMARDAFDDLFFANLVLVLDQYFVHRTRGIEKKDGNPLNEVRMICNAVLTQDGVLAADSTIKYQPGKSVLKFDVGDRISIGRSDFARLLDAYFAEIEAKFGA